MYPSEQISEEVERGKILDSIIEVLKKDARFKALASLGSERRFMVRGFIKALIFIILKNSQKKTF